jgi:hypothetical protein
LLAEGATSTLPHPALAAVAQRGLGRVAAVAMGDDSAAYGEFMTGVLKNVMPPAGDRRFTLEARRQSGTDGWLVTADGVEGDKFLDGQRMKLRVVTNAGGDALLEMPQAAPGRYAARVENTDAFVGIIVRADGDGERFVGRVAPAQAQIGEWPASVEQKQTPADARAISSDPRDPSRWNPHVKGWRISFSTALWMAACGAALLILWIRRGPTGGTRLWGLPSR